MLEENPIESFLRMPLSCPVKGMISDTIDTMNDNRVKMSRNEVNVPPKPYEPRIKPHQVNAKRVANEVKTI